MFRQRFIVTALMVVALLLPSAVQAQGLPDFVAVIDTEDVMSHVRALSVAIGARPMGSEAEAQAAQYVAANPGEVCPAKWNDGSKTLKPSLQLVGKI